MNTDNTPRPEAFPVAHLLYAPARGGGFGSDPLSALPREDLLTSYERQWYRFEWEGKNYALRPSEEALAPSNPLWPEAHTPEGEVARRLEGAYILSAWHPEGVTSNQSERGVLWNTLLGLVEDTGLPSLVMTALQGGSQWVEPVILVTGMSSDKARELTVALGQQVAVAVEGGWHRPQLLDGSPAEAYAWSLHLLPGAPCAMSLGCEVTFSPQRVGGPYGSRAIEVASLWSQHRRHTHQLLACDPCRSGASVATVSGKDISGAPIALSEVFPATRYTYSYHERVGEEPPTRLGWAGPGQSASSAG
jgi:hypothetical protein